MPEPLPPVDYSSRDWLALRTDLIAAKSQRMREWTSESPNDFGIVLIELFAYVGDMLSFYADRVANEAFLDSAVLRSSVLTIARMLDYRPTGLGAATTTLQFTTTPAEDEVTIPAGFKVQTVAATGESAIIFETDEDLVIPGGGGSHVEAVSATQGVTTVDEVIGTSAGTPFQRFALFNSPVVDNSIAVTVVEGASELEWSSWDHLLDAGPNDAAYTTRVDEGGITYVEFGDDVNGRLPLAGAQIKATYRTADGAAGNVGIGTVTQPYAPLVVMGETQGIQAVSNSGAATGGADPESIASIRENAPRALTAIDRAVTVADYAALARKITGIGKAAAYSTVANTVYLYLAPTGSGGSDVSALLKSTVQAYLDDRKMIGTTINIDDPTYVSIDIEVDIHVLPTYKRTSVTTAVTNALTASLAYDNVDFESRVSISMIYRAMNAVEGVDYAGITMLDRQIGTPGTVADQATVVDDTLGEIPVVGDITVNATGGIT